MSRALADSGYDPASGEVPDASTIAALQHAGASLDTADFRAAVDRVNVYFERECGG